MMIAVPGPGHRQYAAGSDVGVLQEVEGDELVVVAGLLVVEDRVELLQMPGPQVVIDVAEGGLRQRPHASRDTTIMSRPITFSPVRLRP